MEYILIAQLVIELLKIMKEKDKDEGLVAEDVIKLAHTACEAGLISDDLNKSIFNSAPDIKALIEDVAGLIGGE